VIDAFSTRRAQVVEHMAEQSTSGFHAAQVAAVATREHKEELDLPRLREEWRARAAEHGLGRREPEGLGHRSAYREPSRAELVRAAERMLGPDGLTEKRSAFTAPELVMAWAQAHAQGAPVERIRSRAARFLTLPGVERVGEAPAPEGSPTTRRPNCFASSATRSPSSSADAAAMPRPFPLTSSTSCWASGRSACRSRPSRSGWCGRRRRAATASSRWSGPPGAGKTAAIHAAAKAFRAAGIPVLGAAPSGTAAEAGIPSATLHRLLGEARQAGGLPRGTVLVVDEAGMAETRILALLLALVDEAEGKALLVGDPHQLAAVGAGGLFGAIVERQGAVQLRENHRQRDEVERRALEALRGGLGREYLAFAEQRERLVVSDDPLETRTRLLADSWQAAKEDLSGSVMIALRRADVAELNAAARALMEAEGKLGKKRLEVAGRNFAVGDRIVCRRNADALGVRNGTRGTVTALEQGDGALTVATDRGGRVELPRAYLEAGHVQHAYALTGHAGQGLTVERAFVLGSDRGRLQEWGYVALSRAREPTRLYVSAELGQPESHFHELDERDPFTRLAQALEESGADRLASEQRPPPAGLRHDSRPVLARRPQELERSRLRFLEKRERETELLRARAERGRALRSEIALQQSALTLAEEKLAELEHERTHSSSASRSPSERPLARAGPRSTASANPLASSASTSASKNAYQPSSSERPIVRSSSCRRRIASRRSRSSSRSRAASMRARSLMEATWARTPWPRYSRRARRRRSS
jgi:AAA domain